MLFVGCLISDPLDRGDSTILLICEALDGSLDHSKDIGGQQGHVVLEVD